MAISRSEWADWREHPVTKEFMKLVRDQISEGVTILGKGGFHDAPNLQNQLIGKIGAFQRVLEVTHEGE